MYTRIKTGVAYLERKEMEINIWVFKNKRKIEFFEFFKVKYQKRVTPLLTGNTQFDAHVIVTFIVSIADGGY
jgi:hypothetical protein